VNAERAADLLALSGRSVKTAIVMGLLGFDRAAAQERLAASGGRVSLALAPGK